MPGGQSWVSQAISKNLKRITGNKNCLISHLGTPGLVNAAMWSLRPPLLSEPLSQTCFRFLLQFPLHSLYRSYHGNRSSNSEEMSYCHWVLVKPMLRTVPSMVKLRRMWIIAVLRVRLLGSFESIDYIPSTNRCCQYRVAIDGIEWNGLGSCHVFSLPCIDG